MPAGRPTTYTEEILTKTEEYIVSCEDEIKNIVESENDKTGRARYIQRIKVNLPSIEGLSLYIDTPRRTIYEWKDKHPKFSHTLDQLLAKQAKMLIDNGLSGDYNSTIAKLMLSSNHGMREKSDMTSDGKPIEGNTIIFKNFKKDGAESK